MPRKLPPRAVLPCPTCGQGDVYVQESRGTSRLDRITRKRVCAHCRKRWGTTEFPDVPPTEAVAQEILDFAQKALAAFKRTRAA